MFSSKLIDKDFKNKIFILTGYSKGIGKQLYSDLKKFGSKLILIGRKKIKDKNFFYCDLNETKKLNSLTKKISRKFNKIDGFIHCAGANNCVLQIKYQLMNGIRFFQLIQLQLLLFQKI